ncbi:tripartite tricarboxylate transporter permease [Natrarchaeobius oligotrophus]|uniref:DUF112 domain-containing protein n=1 Tax=Natrarchaeobius chitinivorans TaxID=1679083 RepID=A0A3N6MSI2_NATCH|nr:tripartite tricarboxylate transporter permease [Natrarchaeobius chitinivorans]RQH00781.1 hypothetical protein EA472_09075 [Natrarchaeobius chitinivorans]
MSMAAFSEAVGILLSAEALLLVALGILIGIVIGSLPGIGPALGMALLLPLTLFLDGISALVFLVSVYSGGVYGGSISAILFNVPGTAASAATTFDGYPMTRQGKAFTALSISAISSSLSGALIAITLILISPFIVSFVLLFGSPEYFLITILGISMITIVSRGSMVKGVTAGVFGLALTTIGTSTISPVQRYTFGTLLLYDGLEFIAIIIGVFAISEMIKLSSEEGGIAKKEVELSGERLSGFKTVGGNITTFLKSSYIGMMIGSIPGAGAAISNFVAYSEAVRSSNDPDSFGSGNVIGVLSSESSNNATVGGSLIPTLSFGVPGSAATAVLLGGLIMHGVRPGPSLFTTDIHVVYSVFLAVLIGNVVILIVGILLITRMNVITRVDTDYIITIIIILSVLGGYTLRNNWIDVFTILIFGYLGYYMVKYNYSIVAFILGAILGGIAEENLDRSLRLSDGSVEIFFTSPLSIVLILAIVLILLEPVIRHYR